MTSTGTSGLTGLSLAGGLTVPPDEPAQIAGGQVTWLRVACALISSAWSGSK